MNYLFFLCLAGLLLQSESAFSVLKSNITNIIRGTPGEVIPMKLTLGNELDDNQKYTLTLVDYSFNAQGENFFPAPGTQARSSGKWIEFTNDQVIIPPRQDLDIFYTIRIPNDPSLKGSYWSVILIEPERIIAGKPASEKNEMQINIKIRYAYQIVVNIGAGIAKLKVLDKKVVFENEKKKLNLDIANNGEIFLNPKLLLKIFDQKGVEIKKLESAEQKIYPDTSIRYILDVNDVPSKKYTAIMLLDNRDENLFGDRFEITVP